MLHGNSAGQEGVVGYTWSDKKRKTCNQGYSIQQESHSDSKEKIKTFTDKQKLRGFSTAKPALQQMLKEFL